jgi:uncharacterized protein (TIGR00369 family)
MSDRIEPWIHESFQRQSFMRTIGAELTDALNGRCRIVVPFHEGLTQQHGYFHGGVIGTIADNAAGYAAYSVMSESSAPLTVEYKLNLLNPGLGEYLSCRSRVIKPGRTLKVCRSTVVAHRGSERVTCAVALVTIIELRDRSDRVSESSAALIDNE